MSVFGPNLPEPPWSATERETLATIRARCFEPSVQSEQSDDWCPICQRHRSPSPFKPCPVCVDERRREACRT